MNHLPYKEWLLSDEPLSSEQTHQLEEHVRNCPVCQQIEPAWSDIRSLMRKTSPAQPAPGFADRWQSRLVAHKLQKQRRLAWILWGMCAAIVAVLLAVFSAQIVELLSSPGHLILIWISRITGALSIYWAIQNFLGALSDYVPAYSLVGLVLGVGLVSFLSVSWLATIRRLTLARRLV